MGGGVGTTVPGGHPARHLELLHVLLTQGLGAAVAATRGRGGPVAAVDRGAVLADPEAAAGVLHHRAGREAAGQVGSWWDLR